MISSTFLSARSLYMENLMRHRFIYDVSRLLLLRSKPELVTVLKAEVDDAGVDLVLTWRNITRPIQMKTLAKRTTNNPYSVAESLGGMIGGGVIWICYDRKTLEPTGYHFMGKRGRMSMQSLKKYPAATKNKKGVKTLRTGYRSIRIRDADHRNLELKELVEILFDLD